jgi:hypothetical protein
MTKRVTAQVSPLRGMPVEDWIQAKAPGWRAAVVRKLLAMAGKIAPKASVAIKWGQPVIEENGPVAFIKVAKQHVTFGFWRSADLTDAKGVLEGGDRMKHVKIRSEDGFDERTLSTLLRRAVSLNREHGDPTRR